ALDPEQPVYAVKSMDQLVTSSLAQRQLNMVLFVTFSAIALILASVGIYGVMSYMVTQRTHEIGIRMALGARQGNVVKLVLAQGMLLVLIGISAGLVGAVAITRVMGSLLFDVSATDPPTFVIVV